MKKDNDEEDKKKTDKTTNHCGKKSVRSDKTPKTSQSEKPVEPTQASQVPQKPEEKGSGMPPFFEMLKGLFEQADGVEVHEFAIPLSEIKKSHGRIHVEVLKHGQKEGAPDAENGEEQRGEKQEKRPDPFAGIRNFHSTPRELRDYLNRFVISQEAAKRVLSVAVCDHYNHVRHILEEPKAFALPHAKHNVILMGPTGCGKTYLMRCLAEMLGVPFIKADATKYSETGYVGYDVEEMVRDLVKAANGNVDLAQFGIIYIDEIDKLAGGHSEGGRDVSGRGVQINLLKMMEDSDVKVLGQGDMFSHMRAAMSGGVPQRPVINTRNILFIVSGAFDRLPEIIRKRTGRSLIGFGAEATAKSNAPDDVLLQDVQTEDLVQYGFEPEFVGRLPVRVALSTLSIDDLEKVLTSVENGFLSQYEEAFRGYGIKLVIQPDAIRSIAEKAYLEKTGARGLLTVLEHLFRNFKFELPGRNLDTFTVSAETVAHPDETLKKILAEYPVVK